MGKDRGLLFGSAKIKFMYLSQKHVFPHIQLKMNDDIIEQVEQIKFLGMIFDSKMTW